tara:strand:+ start:14738 stop:16744 length:2007 start_codon:yes stop_codon:yes gene_type:complete
MNGYGNNSRTLSGTNELNITQLNIDNNVGALTIRGDKGLPNQVLAKNGTTNRLEWDFAESTTIPVNSITNDKLKDKTIENNKIKDGTIIASLLASDITINTTGNISANDGKFDEIELPNTSVGANINVELNSTGIYTLNNKIIKSGGVLEGKTLLINNGDSNSLPMVVMGNGSVIGTLKSTTFQLPTTGQADDWVVRLNSTGINTTKDITALGIITGEDGKFDEIECPKTGSPDVIITDSGITTSSGTAIACGGALSGQGLSITNGQGTAVAVVGGDVDVTRQLKSTRVGNNTPPVPGAAYSEFALNLSNAKGDAYIGRNLICGGDIYGNVIGTITEEVVDCQRLNVRVDPTGATGGATGVTITGNDAILSFVGHNGHTGIDLSQRNIVGGPSGQTLIQISGTNGNLTATGSINLGGGGTRTIQIGATSGTQTYTNSCDTIVIGSTASLSANTTIALNGTTTLLVNDKIIRGNGNKLNGIYRNALSLFDMRGDKITHSLNGTHQKTMCNRSSSQREQTIPNGRAATIGDTGYLNPTGFGGIGIVATSAQVRIHMDAYFLVSSGNPDLYCRIDSTITKTNAPYPSQSHPHLLTNTAGTAGFNQRKHATILITGLTIGDTYKFYPRFATTSSATCKWVYGGVYGDALLSHIFLEDLDVSDPLAPASDDDY